MKRVLFVDGEPRALKALGHEMLAHLGEWAFDLAASSSAAVEILSKRPCHLLIANATLPESDLAALLTEVSRSHPEIIRVVFSGSDELTDIARRAAPFAHQCIGSPLHGPDVLQKLLARVTLLDKVVTSEAVRGLLGSVRELPHRPETYSRLQDVTAAEDFGLHDVTAVIERDPGICTRVLHRVNAGFFTRHTHIHSIRHAVSLLGIKTVKHIVLASEVYDGLGHACSMDMDRLYDHSFCVGRTAAAFAPARLKDDAFLAGLLHDVGCMVLDMATPGAHRRAQELARSEQIPLLAAESKALGINHGEAGAYLLGAWGMPLPILEVVRYHHEPLLVPHAETDLVTFVHVADCLVDNQPERIDVDFLKTTHWLKEVKDWFRIADRMAHPDYEGFSA
ncbi:MAG: HDOD domain-containing protein [Myxococcota bacterium]